MSTEQKIAVIGGGSWATALVKILCNNVSSVNWWMRNEEAVSHILNYKHNPNYLQSVEFNLDKIAVSSDLIQTIEPSDIIIIASPSAFLVNLFKDVPTDLLKDKVVFSAVKGIIPEYNAIPARFIHKTFGTPYDKIGIICGPCHAEEVAMERLSYLTVACQREKSAEYMASVLSCRYIKTTVSDDLFGTEFSAVLKNIYALASGIYAGLGYGDNFQSVFSTIAKKSLRDEDGCNQIKHILINATMIEEPLWYAGLSIAQHCKDRDTAIHLMSENHKDYDPDITEAKATQSQDKPFSCEKFNDLNPTGCDGCSHRGKITNPLAIGKEFVPAPSTEITPVEQYKQGGSLSALGGLPKDLYPFVYGGTEGGIYFEHPQEIDEEIMRLQMLKQTMGT